jgi:hypothetical protein
LQDEKSVESSKNQDKETVNKKLLIIFLAQPNRKVFWSC